RGDLVPFAPTTSKVNNILDALRALIFLRAHDSWPRWLGGNPLAPADWVIALENGLLDMRGRRILPHTPRFLTTAASGFSYTPGAVQEPVRWLRFLRELWADDDEAIAVLGEIFGYLLTPDTRQQ